MSVCKRNNEPAPFSYEPTALDAFHDCNFSPISFEEAKSGKADRPVRVLATGVYDLMHLGHMNMLKQAKEAFPNVYLIAGVLGQEACLKYKGPNVQPNETRYEAVRHCKHVDEVFPDFPFGCMTLDTLQTLKIDFIAHDELPCLFPGTTDAYKHVKAAGRFVTTSRTLGISTTDIVARIVKKYEEHPLLFK